MPTWYHRLPTIEIRRIGGIAACPCFLSLFMTFVPYLVSPTVVC
jgi:hypothetical protein